MAKKKPVKNAKGPTKTGTFTKEEYDRKLREMRKDIAEGYYDNRNFALVAARKRYKAGGDLITKARNQLVKDKLLAKYKNSYRSAKAVAALVA